MRAGDDLGVVFDALHAGGHIAVHSSEVEKRDALADHLAATRVDGGCTATVVVDTREHAATLNAAIRDRLVSAGAVDDCRVAVTHDGQRLGAGDVIVTRRNDHNLGIANRETWTVARVHRDGRLTVDDSGRGRRELTGDYVRGHVELGYAVTGYGAQGDTAAEAHLVLTETTTGAAGYVAMTRGREANTAHLVAADLDDAREQWIDAFGRDRADLGPAAAGQAAARAAATPTRSPGWTPPNRLVTVTTRRRRPTSRPAPTSSSARTCPSPPPAPPASSLSSSNGSRSPSTASPPPTSESRPSASTRRSAATPTLGRCSGTRTPAGPPSRQPPTTRRRPERPARSDRSGTIRPLSSTSTTAHPSAAEPRWH
jgi:hypothetical protein